jgi:hypothetical protein
LRTLFARSATVMALAFSACFSSQAAEQRTPSLVAAAQAPASPLEQRVDDAFLASYPLYEMARARFNAAINPLNPYPFPPNAAPAKRRALIDHTARDVTTPNNDTLYVATWLDLHHTPMRVQVPKVGGGRYWSIALIDIFTDNFAILGSQRDGAGPVDVIVVGPDWKGALPKGRVIRATSNDVQVIGRFLVNGPDDAAAVHALQDATVFTPVIAKARPLPQWVPVTTSTDPANFLAVVNEMLSRNPVPAAEAKAFASWADLGIGGGAYAFVRSSAEVQAA